MVRGGRVVEGVDVPEAAGGCAGRPQEGTSARMSAVAPAAQARAVRDGGLVTGSTLAARLHQPDEGSYAAWAMITGTCAAVTTAELTEPSSMRASLPCECPPSTSS